MFSQIRKKVWESYNWFPRTQKIDQRPKCIRLGNNDLQFCIDHSTIESRRARGTCVIYCCSNCRHEQCINLYKVKKFGKVVAVRDSVCPWSTKEVKE